MLKWEYKKRVDNHFGMALNSMRIARELHPGARVDYDQLASSGVKRTFTHVPELEASEPVLSLTRPDDDEYDLTRPSFDMLSDFGYGEL